MSQVAGASSSIGIAIVRNAGIGAAAGSREDEQPSTPFDKTLK